MRALRALNRASLERPHDVPDDAPEPWPGRSSMHAVAARLIAAADKAGEVRSNVTDLAHAAKVSRVTVGRVLRALVVLRLIERSGGKGHVRRYRVKLGQPEQLELELPDVARAHAELDHELEMLGTMQAAAAAAGVRRG